MGKVSKRVYDLTLATVGLVVLSPGLLFVVVVVKISDCGPVFFRQMRIGLNGNPFAVVKFRTMSVHAETIGPMVTSINDARITPVGRILRRYKLDEFPQLWNVIKGEMSFVGPRPEVPRYTNNYNDKQRLVLELKPGITDPATLLFYDEEELLSRADNIEEFYVKNCIPKKIALNLKYGKKANLWLDTKVIVFTVLRLFTNFKAHEEFLNTK